LVKAGIFLTTAQMPGTPESEVFSRALHYASEAEALGYEQAWILEHHFTAYGLCPSAIVLASHLLGRTHHLEVGTAISIIALDHPVRIAEQVAMLDHLSGGRFLLGIGRGMFTKDFDVFGVDMSKTLDIVKEWVDVFEHAWDGLPFSYEGQFVQFPEINVRPTPSTALRPPVHVVCTSADTISWAARLGLPMILNYRIEDDQKVQQLQAYAAEAEEHGHDPASIHHALSMVAAVADSQKEAETLIRPGLEWWIDQGLHDSGLLARYMPNYSRYYNELGQVSAERSSLARDLADVIFRLNPIGTPEHCGARLEEIVSKTGIENFILGFEGPLSEAATIESMSRFASEVLPDVRRFASVAS
jgi:alkanal monooxygenase alpha chain